MLIVVKFFKSMAGKFSSLDANFVVISEKKEKSHISLIVVILLNCVYCRILMSAGQSPVHNAQDDPMIWQNRL